MSENQTRPAPASDPVQSGRDAIARERARLVASNAHWWDATDDEKTFARLLNPVPPVDAAWNGAVREALDRIAGGNVTTSQDSKQRSAILAAIDSGDKLAFKSAMVSWMQGIARAALAVMPPRAAGNEVADLDAAPFLAVEDEEAGGQE